MSKILVIDDEQNIRETIRDLLSFHGYEVSIAENGKIGIVDAMNIKPDLIICDIMMPELNGYETLKLVRENQILKNTAFIFLTAMAEAENLRSGMNLGADDYLIKPFTTKDLISAIESRLKRKEQFRSELDEKISGLKDTISNTFTHELNTPLGGILGAANLLLNYKPEIDNEEETELLQLILQSGLRLKILVDKFLFYQGLLMKFNMPDLLKYEKKTELQIKDIVAGIVHSLGEEKDRKEDMVLDIEDVVLSQYHEPLSRTMFELIDNAFKFSEKGTPVTIEGKMNADKYMIRVSDKGKGMSSEEIKFIGSSFTQFNREKEEQQGLGLGLSIISLVSELYKYELGFESSENSGTTATIMLNPV